MTLVKQPCVYILASQKNGTLYSGVTSDLVRRVAQHKGGAIEGFSKQHHVHLLVWFEQHAIMESAIKREKQITRWRRDWKLALIEGSNPNWDDLYPSLF